MAGDAFEQMTNAALLELDVVLAASGNGHGQKIDNETLARQVLSVLSIAFPNLRRRFERHYGRVADMTIGVDGGITNALEGTPAKARFGRRRRG